VGLFIWLLHINHTIKVYHFWHQYFYVFKLFMALVSNSICESCRGFCVANTFALEMGHKLGSWDKYFA
jgi:hypothetical protein